MERMIPEKTGFRNHPSELFNGLNEAQRKAVFCDISPILIAAGAGSGKTKTLVSRLVHLLNQGVRPDEIIAITFTNKAAEEMARRLPTDRPPFIGTFHSLGFRILKSDAGGVGRN